MKYRRDRSKMLSTKERRHFKQHGVEDSLDKMFGKQPLPNPYRCYPLANVKTLAGH